MLRNLVIVTGLLAATICAAPAGAQEVVTDQVWLGGSMFTIDDLENLDEAVKLSPEQKDAALTLMRGAMAKARTITLKCNRAQESREDGVTGESSEAAWNRYKELMTEVLQEFPTLEREVMMDLRALLSEDQSNAGWDRFERSRRRLILRDAQGFMSFVQQQIPRAPGAGAPATDPLPDLFAMTRAAKPTPEERAQTDPILENYSVTIDRWLQSWRPLHKRYNRTHRRFWFGGGDVPDEADKARLEELFSEARRHYVQAACKVEAALRAESGSRFLRQRLYAESRWTWHRAKKFPGMVMVLRLGSLTDAQRERVLFLAADADQRLLQNAVDLLHFKDDATLAEKPVSNHEFGLAWSKRHEREQAIRKELMREVVALLTPEQREAYETGIETEQDLANAFVKRRAAVDNPWDPSDDLDPWGDPSPDPEDLEE